MRRELINWTLGNTEAKKTFLKGQGIYDEEQAENEVYMIETILKVKPPLKLLDIGCGTSNHSIEFATRGYEVTSIDAADIYLKQAVEQAKHCNLDLDFRLERGSWIRDLNVYDFAISYYQALGFMEEEELDTYLENVCKSLKEGGQFLLRTSDLEIIPNVEGTQIQSWSEKDNKFILHEKYIKDGYRFQRFIAMDIIKDEIIEYQEKQKTFSLNTIIDLMEHAGFSKIDCYKDLDGRIATNEEFAVYVCRK